MEDMIAAAQNHNEEEHLQFLDDQFVTAFNKMQEAIHANAREKGWWVEDDTRNDGTKIALMHSELSEALEAIRNGDGYSDKIPEFKHVTEELADVVIRIMDYCERRKLNISAAILAKHQFNRQRAYKHGGKEF